MVCKPLPSQVEDSYFEFTLSLNCKFNLNIRIKIQESPLLFLFGSRTFNHPYHVYNAICHCLTLQLCHIILFCQKCFLWPKRRLCFNNNFYVDYEVGNKKHRLIINSKSSVCIACLQCWKEE